MPLRNLTNEISENSQEDPSVFNNNNNNNNNNNSRNNNTNVNRNDSTNTNLTSTTNATTLTSEGDYSGSFTPSSGITYDTEEITNNELNDNDQFDELLPPANPFLDNAADIDESDDTESNEFGSEESEDLLLPGNNNTNNSSNQRSPYKKQEPLGSPYADYRGYYSKEANINNNIMNNDNSYDSSYSSNSNSNVNNSSQTTGQNAGHISTSQMVGEIPLNQSFIQAPKPFDRYPKVSSNVPSPRANFKSNSSTDNTPIRGPVTDMPGSGIVSGSSVDSSYNTLMEKDFSPFGGYPTSNFPLDMDEKEADDYLHNPDAEEEARLDKGRMWNDFKRMNKKSFGGLIGILFLFAAAIVVFIVLPALTFTGNIDHSSQVVVVNETLIQYLTEYEYPQLSAIRTSLVDPDTPSSAYKRKARDGSNWDLVFSDEFNAEGRTFYDGDDQYWTAPDIHYAATKDLEWYSPDASTTTGGTLQLRMDAFKSHNLLYRSGMLQSWNKFCFTQGAVEISANLPNYGQVTGLWPGLWTMGNLARPGFLASTEGLWPYSYDSCDAGITPNQSSPDGISYLPGQRLSACTCDGEDHPTPGIGRGAPEIDIIEGEVDTNLRVGVASQSLQVAPFDIWYIPDYDFMEIYNFTVTTMNSYTGGPLQQAVSAVTTLNTDWYEYGPNGGKFQKFSVEYLNDDTDGYIQWGVGDDPTFTIHARALHPNGNIDWRQISKEPMSIIMNLGISTNWAYIDWRAIFFPVTMSIDYVRVYQPKDAISITCDPEDFPTYDYIEAHKNAYTNANLTSWKEAGYTFPLNKLTGNCDSTAFDARGK